MDVFRARVSSRAAKAVTIMGLSFRLIDTAVGVHRAIKQQELQNEMLHEQAADIRSMVYGPQVYQNAKSVEGFFLVLNPRKTKTGVSRLSWVRFDVEIRVGSAAD